MTFSLTVNETLKWLSSLLIMGTGWEGSGGGGYSLLDQIRFGGGEGAGGEEDKR